MFLSVQCTAKNVASVAECMPLRFYVRQPQECEQEKPHLLIAFRVLESRNRGLEINIDLVI